VTFQGCLDPDLVHRHEGQAASTGVPSSRSAHRSERPFGVQRADAKPQLPLTSTPRRASLAPPRSSGPADHRAVGRAQDSCPLRSEHHRGDRRQAVGDHVHPGGRRGHPSPTRRRPRATAPIVRPVLHTALAVQLKQTALAKFGERLLGSRRSRSVQSARSAILPARSFAIGDIDRRPRLASATEPSAPVE